MKLNQPLTINISTLAIIKVILLATVLYFLFLISNIVVILFASMIFASAVDPWVDWLQDKGIPRGISILLIMAGFGGLAAFIVYLMIPPIVTETTELINNLPAYLEELNQMLAKMESAFSRHDWLAPVQHSLNNLKWDLNWQPQGFFSTISNLLGGIFGVFLILVITFYMTVEESAMKKLVWSTTPDKHQAYVIGLINRIQKKIGLWFRGQLFLCLVVFALTYMGLSILGVKYALVLALIAGLTEAVPYLGPILAGLPAVFIALTQSPMLALFVIILYVVIQQVENYILVPKIMDSAVGLNPIISIVVLMIGWQLAGVLGAILAIPLATAAGVIIHDLFEYKKLGQ